MKKLMFKLLFVSGTTACFELENKNPYYSPEEYGVLLNGEKVLDGQKANVFSLFNLYCIYKGMTTALAGKTAELPIIGRFSDMIG